MLTVERKLLQTIVAAVGNEDHRFIAARVADDAVRAIELSRLAARTSERADVVATLVVLDHVARPVTVSHVDVAVGGDRQVGRPINGFFAIGAWLVAG